MKRFTLFFLLIAFACSSIPLQSMAGPGFDYSLGQRNFFEVTRIIKERYDAEVPLTDILHTAWSAMEKILPATLAEVASEVTPATYDQLASKNEVQKFYVNKIETTLEHSIKKRPDDATPTVLDLWNAATNGLVMGLKDPFSQFLPPAQAKELQRVLSGQPDESKQFFGVGISVEWDTRSDEGVYVISPLPGTPAERNNIQAGDVIIGVNGESFKDWEGTYQDKLERAVEKIKGEKDTEVVLQIRKPDSPEPIDVTLTREPINPELHLSKEMLDDEVGHLRLYSFYANADKEVRDALRYLKMEGMKKLIFDLRYNPGGYLDQAVKVANLFLDEGDLITYTSGRKSKPAHFYAGPTPDDGFEQIPMVILLNQFSASASEVVTGAIKDNKRATIVGKNSFGKGSVQEVFPLNAKAALRLTVAKYYTPDGICIHEKGIKPDIEVDPLNKDEWEEIRDKDYTDVPRTERLFEGDPQLKVAFQVLKGEIAINTE